MRILKRKTAVGPTNGDVIYLFLFYKLRCHLISRFVKTESPILFSEFLCRTEEMSTCNFILENQTESRIRIRESRMYIDRQIRCRGRDDAETRMNDTLSPSLLIGFYFFEFLILTMGEFASALKLSFYLLIFMYNYLKLLLFFLPFFFFTFFKCRFS